MMFVHDKSIDRNLCFVLMPFRDQFENVYKNIEEVVVVRQKMTCVRADNIYSAGVIIQEIWDKIQEAHVIVADCTDKNPNVLYEIGLAHAIGKDDNVILITHNIDDIPFDLRHRRIITYSSAGLNELSFKLSRTIEAIRGKRSEIQQWLNTSEEKIRVGVSSPVNNQLVYKTPIPASGQVVGLSDSKLKYTIQGFVITDKEYQQGSSSIDVDGYWHINEIHLGASSHRLFYKVFDEAGRAVVKSEEIIVLKKNL
jgi:hypothetical protein